MKALNLAQARRGLKMAPLIDVVFLLLIFFLVATTFYEEEKDITIRLAEASEGKDRTASPQIIVVNVQKSGVIVVNQRVKSIDQLRKDLEAAREGNPDTVVVVRCDRLTHHKYFVRILNLCEKAGITSVAVATFNTDS